MKHLFLIYKAVATVVFAFFSSQAIAQTFFVSPSGNDIPSAGSAGSPWATISYAIDQVDGGATILVAAGTYNGRVRLDRQFSNDVLIRSATPYQARLRYDSGAALICFSCQGIIVEGFDIAHASNNSAGLVIQIQNTGGVARNVTLRNNIIHDSTNNDLLKINNGARDILVEGNIFYNQQGSDEHIDINSVTNVTVRDNVFFNSTQQTQTSSYIVIKDSNGNSDGVLGVKDVNVQRNVFFNWQGNDGQSFIRVGEDGTANFEAERVLVENNLLIGNSDVMMRSAFTVQGSKDVTFRFNTIAGNLPSRSFAARLLAVGSNQANQNIVLSNNIWSDPTGTMGTEGFNGADVFEALLGNNTSLSLSNNLYFNGGNAIPADASQQLKYTDDATALVADPRLPASSTGILPTFNGNDFAGGYAAIRDVFVALVQRFGAIAGNSPAINRSGAFGGAPYEDILGNPRSNADIGAFEVTGGTQNTTTVLPWLLLLDD